MHYDKCTVFSFERLRCEARAFFFVANYPYFAKYVLNGKNSTIFSKNSGKKFAYIKKCLYLCTRKTNKTI